jgi:hypothetical protein
MGVTPDGSFRYEASKGHSGTNASLGTAGSYFTVTSSRVLRTCRVHGVDKYRNCTVMKQPRGYYDRVGIAALKFAGNIYLATKFSGLWREYSVKWKL